MANRSQLDQRPCLKGTYVAPRDAEARHTIANNIAKIIWETPVQPKVQHNGPTFLTATTNHVQFSLTPLTTRLRAYLRSSRDAQMRSHYFPSTLHIVPLHSTHRNPTVMSSPRPYLICPMGLGIPHLPERITTQSNSELSILFGLCIMRQIMSLQWHLGAHLGWEAPWIFRRIAISWV